MAINGEGTVFELIRCEDNAEWLKQRSKGIGGSDVAAIMGLSPWRTPVEVWLEKTGRTDPEDISGKPWIEWGNILEPIVGDKYAKNHEDRTVRRVNAVCRSIERPWAQASLDYEVRDPDVGWGVLEIKTSHDDRSWSDGVPAWYLTQITHYMSVTGRPFADVAVLIGGSDYREYRVMRDEDDIKAVDRAVEVFCHEYVEKDVMPAVVGTSGEQSAMASSFASTGELKSVSDQGIDLAISEYQDAQEACRAADGRKRKAASELMQAIGDARGLVTDTARVTWVRTERTNVDAKALREIAPDIYERVTTIKTTNGGIRITDLAR